MNRGFPAIVVAALLAACAPRTSAPPPGGSGAAPVPSAPEPESPLSASVKTRTPPEAAYDVVLAAVQREKFPVANASKAGLIVHTDWAAPDRSDAALHRVRFDITLSPGLCLVRAEPQDSVRGRWKDRATLDEQGHDTLVRLVTEVSAALARADESAAPIATATPALPRTPFEAALRAVDDAGLHVEQALEAAGRIETSWRDVETGTFGAVLAPQDAPDYAPTIHFRVRYVLQVSRGSVSARAETEKSTDERSWVTRAGMTKSEEQQLEKLRHAIHEELEALEARSK